MLMNRKQSASIIDTSTPKGISKPTRTLSYTSSSSSLSNRPSKITKIKAVGKQNMNQNQLANKVPQRGQRVSKDKENKQNQNNNTMKGLKRIKEKVQGQAKIQDIKGAQKYKLEGKKCEKLQKSEKKASLSQKHNTSKQLLSDKSKKVLSKNIIQPKLSHNTTKKLTTTNSQKSTPKSIPKKSVASKSKIIPKKSTQTQTQISFYTMNQTQTKQSHIIQVPQCMTENLQIPSATQLQFNTYITPSFTQPDQIVLSKLQVKNQVKNQINKNKGLMISMFQIRYKLTQGPFSTTFQVVHIQTGFLFCLKVFQKSKIKSLGVQQQIISEIKFRQNSTKNNKNLQKLYTYFDDQIYLYFIEEYLTGFGTIQKQLHTRRRLPQKQSGIIFKQVLETVKNIHTQNYILRDIRIQNLVKCFGIIKIIDFSWVACLKHKKQRDTFLGDYKYAPPQLIDGNHYDQSIDIWSLGILLYELCTGQSPFHELQLSNKRNSHSMNFPIFLSNQLVDLIGRLLSEKGTRIRIQQIGMHQWTNKWELDGFVNKEIWDFWVL